MALSTVLCADWSASPKGREVYVATVEPRTIERVLPPAGGWTVPSAVAAAKQRSRGGSALLGFDAPLGVPASFWQALRRERPEWAKARSFSGLLDCFVQDVGFFEPVKTPQAWRPGQPFFHVEAGRGGRLRFERAMTGHAVGSLRGIDRLTAGLPAFIAGGIAGAVGSAACDIWRGLGGPGRGRPKLWPFDVSLDELLLGNKGVVVAEIYPRLAYGVALGEGPPPWRRLSIAKNDAKTRAQAVFNLAESAWVRNARVTLDDLVVARESSDAFDALFAAAAILRCLIEETPLSRAELEDREAEGGILCSGSVDFDVPERKFRPKAEAASAIVRIYVELREIEPPVWRRIDVPADFTLAQLHRVLQIAFGWEDRHLHEFRFQGVAFGTPDPEAPPEMRNERKARLGGLVEAGMTGEYLYDFGDDWVHELRIESSGPADAAVTYPVCTGGARACPPEDCGGVPGYVRLLESLFDPRHEEHATIRTWVGGFFDPEGFDANGVNRQLWSRLGVRGRG